MNELYQKGKAQEITSKEIIQYFMSSLFSTSCSEASFEDEKLGSRFAHCTFTNRKLNARSSRSFCIKRNISRTFSLKIHVGFRAMTTSSKPLISVPLFCVKINFILILSLILSVAEKVT